MLSICQFKAPCVLLSFSFFKCVHFLIEKKGCTRWYKWHVLHLTKKKIYHHQWHDVLNTMKGIISALQAIYRSSYATKMISLAGWLRELFKWHSSTFPHSLCFQGGSNSLWHSKASRPHQICVRIGHTLAHRRHPDALRRCAASHGGLHRAGPALRGQEVQRLARY